MPPTYVPGLSRPVSVSEYAKLTGLKEADVLAEIRAFSIRCAHSNGESWLEAPRNSEARLAQLRNDKAETKAEGGLAVAAAPNIADARPVNLNSGSPHAAQPSAPARRPQPIDYGLTFDDLNLYRPWGPTNTWTCRLTDGNVIQSIGPRADDEYKKGRRWFRVLHPWAACSGVVGIAAFLALLIGGCGVLNHHQSSSDLLINVIPLGFGLAGLLFAILPGVLLRHLRARASSRLIAYWQALYNYISAARSAQLRTWAYWMCLDGYSFESATAETLTKHQFKARVTRRSGDGGVDIEVTRNGLRGVVQCKAHTSSVGSPVVRDLYGVIHHLRADFGIIVSRGGFTKGAVDFRRGKPIHFVDLDDLIAMQEGRDVLAAAFKS